MIDGSGEHLVVGCGIRPRRGEPSHRQAARKMSRNRALARYTGVKTGKGSRIDLDRHLVSPPAAVGFSDEDLVWWSEGERIEALEQVEVDAAAPSESSGSHRPAARARLLRAARRVAKRRRLVGAACAGLLLAGAWLVNAGLSGEAHRAQVPLSTPMAADQVEGGPSLAGGSAPPVADAMPAEIAARPAAASHHRARAKSKKPSAPSAARHGSGSRSRPGLNHRQ